MGRKPGRPKLGVEPLSRQGILATALELVDGHGVEALSMRRLATELGVDPMAIYHYLPGKNAILAGLIVLVFSELEASPMPGASWQEQLHTFARSYHNLARAHPNLVQYVISDAESAAQAALEANERLYAALAAAGLPPQMIVRSADLMVDYLNGFALADRSGRLGQPGERQELLTLLNRHPAAQFPTMSRTFSSLTEQEILADVAAGLEIIIMGIEAITRSAHSPPPGNSTLLY